MNKITLQTNPILIKNHLYIKYVQYYNINDIELAIEELILEYNEKEESIIEIPEDFKF